MKNKIVSTGRIDISRNTKEKTNFVSVPIVTIVVEGGSDTILTVYKDLRNNIPVVLIDVKNIAFHWDFLEISLNEEVSLL